MILRDYQIDLIDRIYSAWNSVSNVCAVLPTGGGKTVVFSKIISDHTGYSLTCAHRAELVSQISLTFSRYKIRHNIVAQKNTIREICALQMQEFGKVFFDPTAHHSVAGVDTLLRLPESTSWFKRVTLLVQDEAHHVLRKNKWGRIVELFPNVRGLYPTATPTRADGHGLGRHADGVFDLLLEGPPMRELIDRGSLCEYRIFAPPCTLNLSQIPLSASGDYSPDKLRKEVHKSKITGDVVSHYQRIAAGKQGVTFVVDIEAAIETAAAYRAVGILAEVVTGKTPDLLRAQIFRKFRNKEIQQIVNVDLLGEGIDVPGIEVISMARPTESYCLYSQQFGRALRPLPGKSHAIIIDHVNNVLRHGLPDAPKKWTLDRRERRSNGTNLINPLATCLNPTCLAVYQKIFSCCPYCKLKPEPISRSCIEHVDGDLLELDESTLARLRGEVSSVSDAPNISRHLPTIAQLSLAKRHRERQQSQETLRGSIAIWAGYYRDSGVSDSEIYRRFYFEFNIDVLTAQTLNLKDTVALNEKICESIELLKLKGIKK
jgi:DNA repair protein RadD